MKHPPPKNYSNILDQSCKGLFIINVPPPCRQTRVIKTEKQYGIRTNTWKSLKRFRKKERLSQKHLADLLGYDQRKVSRLERDESEFNANILNTLNESYSINADWLLYGKGQMYAVEQPSEGEMQAEIEKLKAELASAKKENEYLQQTVDAQKMALEFARRELNN